MCGIVGGVGPLASQVLVNTMAEALLHRGPDEIVSWNDGNCFFAMTRLSIVDIESGSQPFFNESKELVSIFNGEIFNHKDLRASLSETHSFRSDHADGEVIPHLYEDFGVLFPEQLDGMFSIGVWSSTNKSLILARDHFGIKPLYYLQISDSLFFSSEIKALLIIPECKRTLDFAQVNNYFVGGHTISPGTVYEDIKQLPPGQTMVYDNSGEIQISTYWKLNNVPISVISTQSELLRELIETSVEKKNASRCRGGLFSQRWCR